MKGEIANLVAEGLYREALSLYAKFHSSSLRPTNFTFPFLLKACGNLLLAQPALQIHAHIAKTGFQDDIYTATALTDTYMKLQMTGDALKMFEGIPHRSLPSFNSIVSGFSQNGCLREALCAFKRLQMEGFFPNSVTIAGILPACRSAEQGTYLHGLSIKLGHELDDYVVTALVTMYLNCRDLSSAQRVFQTIRLKKVVSYNAMISGLFRNGFRQKALDLFEEMMFCSWVRPNPSTLVSVSSICSELSALRACKQIHCYILKHAAGSDITVGTALVDMYCKCGSWEQAYEVFVSLSHKNLITWNSMISGLLSHERFEAAVELFQQLEMKGLQPDMTTWNIMISGYSKNGNAVEALRLFEDMLSAGVSNPSLKSITSLLQACSVISELQYGKEIHAYAIRTGIDNMDDEFFPTSLVHMYMKSGCSLQASMVFDRIENKSDYPALWNSMISGFGRNGENESALETFRKMLGENIQPDSATFLSILSVCSHTGQVEKGWELFKRMSRDFCIDPTAEHFSCVVDLLGRSGKLNEAWELLQEIPCTPSTSVYSSLLGACKCYSDSVIGTVVAERLSELEPGNPTPFVILSNIYAEQGRWDEVESLREMMRGRGLKKNPGHSWIVRNDRELALGKGVY